MATPQQYTAKLEEKIVHNDKFVQFSFELTQPTIMDFTAGQYVSIQVSPDGQRRSYSICSSSDISHGFELLVDVEPQGLGTKFLNNLQFGDEISVIGPMGNFTLQTQPVEPAIALVATGSGIAPFHSMILDLLQVKHDPRPLTLYWGLRFPSQLFWQDEFTDLAENFPNFHFHPVISKPTPDWNLCSGHVTDCLSIHELDPATGFYLCGNKEMIDDVNALLISLEFSQSQIHFEKYN